jgi:hypothetical protein
VRLHVDLDSLQIVRSSIDARTIARIYFVRGSLVPLELQFVRDNAPELLPEGSAIRFALKQDLQFDGDLVAFTDEFTAPEEDTGYYTGSLSLNTEELNALLGSPDETTGNDVASVTLGGSISWGPEGEDPWKTRPFASVVENSYDNGNEGQPTQASSGVVRMDLSGFADGEDTLDTIETTGMATGRLVMMRDPDTGAMCAWILEAGEASEDVGGGTVLPDDYDAESNAKYWTRIL